MDYERKRRWNHLAERQKKKVGILWSDLKFSNASPYWPNGRTRRTAETTVLVKAIFLDRSISVSK